MLPRGPTVVKCLTAQHNFKLNFNLGRGSEQLAGVSCGTVLAAPHSRRNPFWPKISRDASAAARRRRLHRISRRLPAPSRLRRTRR